MASFDDLIAAHAAITNELARKAALPAEPRQDENGNSAIWFRKKWNPGGIWYTYCGVYIPHLGLWYVSGSRSFSHGANWEALVEWITSGDAYELWECTSYELIAVEGPTIL